MYVSQKMETKNLRLILRRKLLYLRQQKTAIRDAE